jgi:hypothetical protein
MRGTSQVALPPHTPDFGMPGNPARWCERCRIEAGAASPLSDDERKALRDILESAQHEYEKSGRWAYFARGGWAGERLWPLVQLRAQPAPLSDSPEVP